MPNKYRKLMFLILMFGATALTTFAQSDANALASFKKETAAYVTRVRKFVGIDKPSLYDNADAVAFTAEYMKNNGIDSPELYDIGHKWRKDYLEISDYTIDVRKTDSLTSPYVGYLYFTVKMHSTHGHGTRAEAEADNEFVVTNYTEMHKHIYAFQDGKWVSKSRQYYDDVTDAIDKQAALNKSLYDTGKTDFPTYLGWQRATIIAAFLAKDDKIRATAKARQDAIRLGYRSEQNTQESRDATDDGKWEDCYDGW